MLYQILIDRLTQVCRSENDQCWDCYFFYKGICGYPNPILDLDKSGYMECFTHDNTFCNWAPRDGIEEIDRGSLRLKKIVWQL